MSDQDVMATSPYVESDTVDQQPAVRCQTDKKLLDPGINQRDHSNNNTDPAHENLDNTQQKMANLEKLFDQQSHSLEYLTSTVERLAKTAKPKLSKRKRRYFTSSSSSSSSSSFSDDEPPKRRKTTNSTVNSDTEQEAQLLMNQVKQPALIVNEDSSSENPTACSTGDILKSLDDESNEEDYGSNISDPLVQRVEGKWQTKLTSEKSRGNPRIF